MEDQGHISVLGPAENLGSQHTVHIEVASLLSTAREAEARQQEARSKGQGSEGLLKITAFTASTLEMSGFSAATQGEGFIYLL